MLRHGAGGYSPSDTSPATLTCITSALATDRTTFTIRKILVAITAERYSDFPAPLGFLYTTIAMSEGIGGVLGTIA